MRNNQFFDGLPAFLPGTPSFSASDQRLSLPLAPRIDPPPVSLLHPASKATSFFHPSAEWLMSIDLKRQVTLVSLRDMLRSEPLRAHVIFEQCFDLYEQSFPDLNEISTSQEIVAALQNDDFHFDVVALIEGGRVLGARHLIQLDTGVPELGPFVVGEHMYVDRTERRRGIGKSLVSRTEDLMRSWGVRVAISEQNDPHAMSPDLLALDESAGISATQRRSFWKSRGYEGIDAPYVMPPISDDKEAVYHLRIAIRRLDPTFPDTIPTESFIGMLRAYHSSWVDDVDSNPHTVALYDRLRTECPGSVRIIDLESPRTCVTETRGADLLPEQS